MLGIIEIDIDLRSLADATIALGLTYLSHAAGLLEYGIYTPLLVLGFLSLTGTVRQGLEHMGYLPPPPKGE